MKTLRAWCASGDIDARKNDRGQWEINLSALAEVMAERNKLSVFEIALLPKGDERAEPDDVDYVDLH